MDLADQYRESRHVHVSNRVFVMRREHFEPHKVLGRRKAHGQNGGVQVDLAEQFPGQQRSHRPSFSQGKK
jgi:hypothetical protein